MIFRKLLGILKRENPAASPRVFDLADHEVKQLKDLRALDEWQTYLSVLDRQMTLYGEAMLSPGARDSAFFHEMRGMCLGLRMAGIVVDDILQTETEREKQSERSRSEPWDARAAALFGTSAWNER